MASVAPCIPADYAMSGTQGGQEGKPLLVVRRPAVKHDNRRTFAGNLYVDLFAVIGEEMTHGWRCVDTVAPV